MADPATTAKRDYVANLFGRIAHRYDLMNTLMTFGLDRRWRRLAAVQAIRGLEGPALDVATGTGELALALARRPATTAAIGLDLLPAMVLRAQAKMPSKRGDKKVQFLVGDALSLPFPDNTFACVTSAFSLRNMPDLKLSLEEMVRVTRPGGRVLSLETLPLTKGAFRPFFLFYFHRVVPLLGSVIAGDRAAYTYLPQSVHRFHSPEGLAHLLEEAGLTEVRCRSLSLGTVYLHWGTKAIRTE